MRLSFQSEKQPKECRKHPSGRFRFRYESLQYAFPQVSEQGIRPLVQALTESLTKPSPQSFFPSYFTLNRDFIDGVEYCVNRFAIRPSADRSAKATPRTRTSPLWICFSSCICLFRIVC